MKFFEPICDRNMIAAGQNLKRLIKHRIKKLCSLAQNLISRLVSTSAITFSTACNIMRRVFQRFLRVRPPAPICGMTAYAAG